LCRLSVTGVKELRLVGLETLDICAIILNFPELQMYVSVLNCMQFILGFDASGLSQNAVTVHWVDAS